jgi:hypothetical protein
MAQKSFSPVISTTITTEGVKVFDKTAKKETEVRAANMLARKVVLNKMLDAMVIACDKPKALFLKGNAATNDARGQIKAFFDAVVEKGALEKSTAATYQTCFWIAFEQGCEWSPDLANKKTADKSEGAKSEAKAKAGSVTETNVPELHKTLSKALAQARILNQSIFAADLVDLITDTWPEFKETVLTK